MLIDEIIDILSRNDGSLSEALLKTKVLLHKLNRKELVSWVNSELNGYDNTVDVPSYRVVSARVMASLISYTFTAESHPIPIQHLSEDERHQLERHEVRQPIGVLEARGDTSGYIRPLPMEANGLLGKNLAAGVRINSAWCEINGQEMEGIAINVRSRLLDFALEIRDAVGDMVDDAALSEKSKGIDTQALFHGAIFGANTTIIYGTGSANIQVEVKSGNLVSLETALISAGVPAEEIGELKQAIAHDKASGSASMEGEVGNWFTRLLGKAAKGTINVGVDVVSSTVAKALTGFLS